MTPRAYSITTYSIALSAGLLLLAFSPIPTSAASPLAEPLRVVSRPSPASKFSSPQGVAVDTVGGLVLVADTGNHCIRAFDYDGYPLRTWYHHVETARGRMLGEPQSLLVSRPGLLYVLDALTDYVDVMDLLGTTIRQIRPADLEGLDASIAEMKLAGDVSWKPTAFALDREEHLLLAFGTAPALLVALDASDQLLWSLRGDEDGGARFGAITDVSVGIDGRIYVTDGTAEPAVRVYSHEPRYLFGFGGHDVGDENFSFPAAVAATADGRIWVIDSIRQVIKVFDREGGFLGYFGGAGVASGDLLYPTSIDTDGRERLFVVERVGARLTSYRVQEFASAVQP